MSVSSSRYPLIRISNTGEMRVKNKVGKAILKENAYEERALNTRLHSLSKQSWRQDKYLSYRQLEFATRQVSASEEKPRLPSIRRESEGENVQGSGQLPPVDSRAQRSAAVPSGAEANSNKAKGRWEKAITLVRVAVQNRQPNEKTVAERKLSRQRAPESKDLNSSVSKLPPIKANAGEQKEIAKPSRQKPPLRKQPSLPEMLKISREKTQRCLSDPRFMKLEQCLSTTKSPLGSKPRKRTSSEKLSSTF